MTTKVKQVQSAIVNNNNELTSKLKKQEATLQFLKKQGVDDSVVKVQEQNIAAIKAELEELQSLSKASSVKLTDRFIKFSVVNEKTHITETVKKKIGFIKHNRFIDKKEIDKFISIISNGKYEKAYPILVARGEDLTKLGYTILDTTGRELTEEEAKNYFVILDGQHRISAFAQLIATGKDLIIPNTYIREIENIGEYLNDINSAGQSWDKTDKVTVASLTTNNELFSKVADLIGEGFNPSTSFLIYTGKKMSDTVIEKALSGKEYKLPKGAILDIKKGDKFITLCKAANIPVRSLTKHYFIGGFNNYSASVGEEQAFEALDKMRGLHLNDEILKTIKDDNDFNKLLAEAFRLPKEELPPIDIKDKIIIESIENESIIKTGTSNEEVKSQVLFPFEEKITPQLDTSSKEEEAASVSEENITSQPDATPEDTASKE